MTSPSSSSTQDLKSYLNSLPEWHDEQKCLSLFSSFRGSVEDAAESWSTRLYFWISLIHYSVPRKWVGNRNILTFHEQKLPQYYQRKGASPLGLSFVLASVKHRAVCAILERAMLLTCICVEKYDRFKRAAACD